MSMMQENFCRILKVLRRKYGLNEWQMGRILNLSDETMDALGRGEVTDEVGTDTLERIYRYYGIIPSQMLGDGEI